MENTQANLVRINIGVIILFVLAECVGCKQSDTKSDGVVIVDVTASYPKKELILQDFMDVEYVPLETNDEFLCQGFVQDVSKDFIFVRNFSRTGEIFIFDRNGKAVKKIKRLGQGVGEYSFLSEVTYDEENKEIFVNDFGKRIFVYDLEGNFKRYFKARESAKYESVKNFDRDYLICYDSHFSNDGETNGQNLLLVSKQDGSIHTIEIPFDKPVITAVISKTFEPGMTWGITPETDYPLIPYQDKWICMEPSSDTLYTLSPDLSKKPFIVRTPSIQTMQPEKFLFLSIVTDRYFFMQTLVREYDFGTNDGYPSTNLVYDRQENAVFKCTVYNGDYTVKKEAQMNYMPINSEVASCHIIPANELVVAYKRDRLKGQLKEIAAGLDEESNPVLMFYKYKKQKRLN